MDANGARVRQITDTGSAVANIAPSFSLGGTQLVFVSTCNRHSELFTMTTDGSHLRQLTHTSDTTANLDPSFHQTAPRSSSTAA
jgi:Tol biopolymer transport system component